MASYYYCSHGGTMGGGPISVECHTNKVKLPIEIIELIIGASNISSLKSWTNVCKTLLPSARYHLCARATLCLRSQSHATQFAEWISDSTTLPAATSFVRRLRFCGAPEETECWFADILERLDKKLEGVHSLTIDFTGVPVRNAVFERLTGLCCENERRGITPLPNLRHLDMLGAESIAVYRVLEVISLFPRLETLRMQKFRWNVLTGLYWIPYPAFLRHIEADIEEVLNPAAFIFALFGESEERQEISTFSLCVTNDHADSLRRFDDPLSRVQHRNYFVQILKAVDRVMPGVEHLRLEVPMDNVKTESETRALLDEHDLLKNLRSLSVNSTQIIKEGNKI